MRSEREEKVGVPAFLVKGVLFQVEQTCARGGKLYIIRLFLRFVVFHNIFSSGRSLRLRGLLLLSANGKSGKANCQTNSRPVVPIGTKSDTIWPGKGEAALSA